MPTKTLQDICSETLIDNKADDVLTLDIDGISSFADAIIIATANSNRHAKSLSERLVESVKANGKTILGVEGKVDYLNTHGTSTPVGDVKELGAIQEVFGKKSPAISATKAMTGHALGAAGVHEAIYSMLMMENNFVAGSAHIDDLDESAEGLPIVRQTKEAQLNRVMCNSFGFGRTNATLVRERFRL